LPESLTRKKNAANLPGGGRLQIGMVAGFKSEYPAGLNRDPQPVLPVAKRNHGPTCGVARSYGSQSVLRSRGFPMSNGPWSFKQRDVTRALKAVRAAGERVIEIKPDGTLVLATPPEKVDLEEVGGRRRAWAPRRSQRPSKLAAHQSIESWSLPRKKEAPVASELGTTKLFLGALKFPTNAATVLRPPASIARVGRATPGKTGRQVASPGPCLTR